jgi:Mrr N-terminal domain/Uncharacterized protein conserved in bacteria (DUF2252)
MAENPHRLMPSASDIFLGWTEGRAGREFYIRQLRDAKIKPLVRLNHATVVLVPCTANALAMKVNRWVETLKLPPKGEVEKRLLRLLSLQFKPLGPQVLYRLLADDFKLTPHQRDARPPKWNESAWNNHVRQARRRLVGHGWVDDSERGLWSITEAGRTRERGPSLKDL